MNKLFVLLKTLRTSESNFIIVLLRFFWIRIFNNKSFLLHQKVSIKGIKNIQTKGIIKVGIDYVGFVHRKDKTYLNIKGKLSINGNYSIGRGCRFDIGENAIVTIGSGGYINCNTNLIIMHNLHIGDN